MLKRMLFVLVSLVLLAGALIFIFTDPFKKNSRAGLQIEYLSGNASVFLNDNYLGKAPLTEEKLQSGEYILKITPDDKKLNNLNLPIYLEKGTLTIVVYNPGETPKNSSSTVFELRKRDNDSSAVSFETYPENAFISFDDGAVTFSPLTIEDVAPGEHHFLVNLPSYEVQNHSFQVLKGYETKITINLAKNIKLVEEKVEKNNEATASVIQAKLSQETDQASQSSAFEGPRVEIMATGFFEGEEEVLKVRAASSSAAAEIGLAKVGSFYPYLGEKSSDQKWLKIQFEQQEAWVSSDFAKVIEDVVE
jgi:hypothetical protein